jgi:hypothetical protein
MNCDPNALSQATSQLRALTEYQLALARLVTLCNWANVAANTGGGKFRITELLEIRSTEAGDLRIVE